MNIIIMIFKYSVETFFKICLLHCKQILYHWATWQAHMYDITKYFLIPWCPTYFLMANENSFLSFWIKDDQFSPLW